MKIRQEKPDDREAIADVVSAAFGTTDGEDRSPPVEVRLVESIRASKNYVPRLSLVAQAEPGIVGHIMLSYVELHGHGPAQVIALAPMAVHPGHQRQGIGGALVEAGLKEADEMAEPLVILVGHAEYYPRFGFKPARPHGLESQWPDLPDEVWMFKPLSAYTDRIRGQVRFPPAFDP